MLTQEQIADKWAHLDGSANIRAINQEYRAQDTSELWPICNRFNATDRAIRKAREYRREYPIYGLEYCYLLDSIISDVVNKEI